MLEHLKFGIILTLMVGEGLIVPALFSDIYFSMKKGVWRSKILWSYSLWLYDILRLYSLQMYRSWLWAWWLYDLCLTTSWKRQCIPYIFPKLNQRMDSIHHMMNPIHHMINPIHHIMYPYPLYDGPLSIIWWTPNCPKSESHE